MHYSGDSETLDQSFQRNGGCPTFDSVQGQVGWSPEQPGLVKVSLLIAEELEQDEV